MNVGVRVGWVRRSGTGRPLLSPPNVPHLVVTCEHCVMLEQRFVFSCTCCMCLCDRTCVSMRCVCVYVSVAAFGTLQSHIFLPIGAVFLDEIHYFMAKAARDWDDRPIMYPFLTDTLQDPGLAMYAHNLITCTPFFFLPFFPRHTDALSWQHSLFHFLSRRGKWRALTVTCHCEHV